METAASPERPYHPALMRVAPVRRCKSTRPAQLERGGRIGNNHIENALEEEFA